MQQGSWSFKPVTNKFGVGFPRTGGKRLISHMTKDASNEILNLAELEARWNVCGATIYNRRRKEGLRYFRMGRLLYFKLSDIHAFEQAQLEKTNGQEVSA